jgi:hypothetical protein
MLADPIETGVRDGRPLRDQQLHLIPQQSARFRWFSGVQRVRQDESGVWMHRHDVTAGANSAAR